MLRHHPHHHPHHFKYPDYKYPDYKYSDYKYSDYKYADYKYPLPLSHPDLAHYEDVDHLIKQLEQEKRHKDSIEWNNAELEKSVAELETYYRELQDDKREDDDNEWKVRFESQGDLNKQLSEQREWLESELMEVRRKLTTASYPEVKKYNLDTLSEPELLRLVKHLERTRNGLYSSMRDMEWKLDKESKEFRHFDEIRRRTREDLKQVNHTLERMQWTRVVDPTGLASPIYNPSYLHSPYWMDTSPLVLNGSKTIGYPYGGRSRARGRIRDDDWKPSVGKPQPSPSRAKSRAEKKAKKKEPPPPTEVEGGEERRNGNSETDNAGDLFDAGKESNPSSGADTYIKEPEAKPKRKSSKDRSHTQE